MVKVKTCKNSKSKKQFKKVKLKIVETGKKYK